MPTQKLARSKKSARKTQSRFQRLWIEAEALAQENQQIAVELNVLVGRIQTEVFQVERQYGETIREFVHRQLDFMKKKSLLKWQRAELRDWIDQNLYDLQEMDLLDKPLQDKLLEVAALEMGFELDPDSNLSLADQMQKYMEEEEAAHTGKGAEHHTDDEDCFGDAQEDLFFEEELEELFQRLNSGDNLNEEEELVDLEPATGKSVTSAVFQRLFRQTAAALHPDRESDDALRIKKHELMSQLLQARKDSDLITVIRLHEKYATADTDLDSDDHKELEGLLENYLNQEKSRLFELCEQSPAHLYAYTQFYDKKPATVTRRINAHVRKVKKQQKSLLDIMSGLKTLKQLKLILQGRYDTDPFRGEWF